MELKIINETKNKERNPSKIRCITVMTMGCKTDSFLFLFQPFKSYFLRIARLQINIV